MLALGVIGHAVALRLPESIFSLAVQYAFTGFSGLAPLLAVALFWRGSTKWGALATTLWVAAGVIAVAFFQAAVPAPPPGPPLVVLSAGGLERVSRTAGGTAILGFLPVVPMVLGSALLMIIVSLVTPKPRSTTIARYFPVH